MRLYSIGFLILLVPFVALAEEGDVHLFDDLNGNGISDASEQTTDSSLQDPNRVIEEEIVPVEEDVEEETDNTE